jgi:hypothetical protein
LDADLLSGYHGVLVDFLAQQGIISESLRRRVALKGSDQANETLRELLKDESVDPVDLAEAMSQFADTPCLRLKDVPPIQPHVIGILPAEVIGETGVLPLGYNEDGELLAGFLDPLDRESKRLVSFFAGASVIPYVIPASDMAAALDHAYGNVWHESWDELFERYRESGDGSAAYGSGGIEEPNTSDLAVLRAIRRGASHVEVPIRQPEADSLQEAGLMRYYEHSRSDVVSGRSADPTASEDIREAFRQASRPGGYDAVNSGNFETAATEEDEQPRVAGFFGATEGLLHRSRETDETASRAFELAAKASQMTNRPTQFYPEITQSLTAVFPISTVWLVRCSELLLAASDSDIVDMSTSLGMTLDLQKDTPWHRVCRTGLSYRGRISPRDPVSRWLFDRSAHHLWIAPFFVSDRLLVLLSVCTTKARTMMLPSAAAYAKLKNVISAASVASASCLRPPRYTGEYEI